MAPCEWVIDIIKEWVLSLGYATEAWVLAKAYATEAWVLEWVTPLNVSGTLDPDATCTYHKAGTLNSQPYYIRNDGEYYIWWNGTHLWLLSEDLGVSAQPLWGRNDPDILGNYAPVAPTIGIATVASGYGCPHRCLVDRGDPAVNDWAVAAFTKDGAWHDLDLSGIVPANAKGVIFNVEMLNIAVGKTFFLRRKGNVNNINVAASTVNVAGVTVRNDLVCPCDENRFVQYKATAVGWVGLNLSVKGWWL